ncbi:serine/arginine repetitive matrix protein 2-like [Cylas formicarius]|uniref:serine/arginine repetitive matrix protein 2-like n=1 Tax=Cylas formicarius TaxID=197179 RepID=UPI002958B5D9|nr:serine/arginine repetitive matrix protein 2-like [Cylas formicarius]
MSGTSSSRDDHTFLRKSTLWKDKHELSNLRVQVKRGNVNATGPQLPLERSIDDPAKICAYVHYRKDANKIPKLPIFGPGIKVNQKFEENRQVFTRSDVARQSRSRSRSRSASPKFKRNKSRKAKSRSGSRSRTKQRISKSRSRSLSHESYCPLSHESDCPMYESLSKEGPSREYSKYRKSKSPTPLRPGEYRPGHPDLAKRYNKKRSPSPSHKDYERNRYQKSVSPSRPGPSSRRSHSPGSSNRYSSPRRSGGTLKNSKRSPSPRRRSRSPVKYNKRERSRSRSSRYRSRSHSRYNKKRSRSPYRNRDRKYYNRSRSPRRKSRSPGLRDHGVAEYGYYDGEYWMPGPVRPGFPVPAFYHPGFYPRGVIPGPMLMPRVPIRPPFAPYPHQRYQMPVYNRTRGNRPMTSTATITSDSKQPTSEVSSETVIQEITENPARSPDSAQTIKVPDSNSKEENVK